ncbi:MAG: DMT family transporter [Planctomycetes bacterium]|nr:DMT family transporter [Planctomycetota bacterium]
MQTSVGTSRQHRYTAGVLTPADAHDDSRRRRYLSGVLLLIGAAVLWSLNGALIKLTADGGRGPGGVVIAFYRSLFAGLVLLPLGWRGLHTMRAPPLARGATGGPDGRARRLRPEAIACVIFFTIMTVCFVVANTKTEAANAIILQYTSTFWVFGLSPWLLGERPRSRDLWILAVAVAGIAVIFLGRAQTDLFGLTVALAAGLFFGLLTLMIRRMRDADPAALTVANNLGSALLILPAVLWGAGFELSARSAGYLVFMGVVQFGIPYYLYTLGLARIPAYHAALITMLEPILVPVWTFLAVGEPVPAPTLLGGALILLALGAFARSARRVAALASGTETHDQGHLA